MDVELNKKDWLAQLISRELANYDPAAAWTKLPPEVRRAHPEGPDAEARTRVLILRSLRHRNLVEANATEYAAFVGPLRGHVNLALDIALIQGPTYDAQKRRAELTAFFAALTGDVPGALKCLPAERTTPNEALQRKVLIDAGAVLKKRGHPPGDPLLGLPLHAGTVAVDRRLVARIAGAYYRKTDLEEPAIVRHRAFAARELLLLVEALSGLVTAENPEQPLDASRRRTIFRQITRLNLPKLEDRAARASVVSPRKPREIARAAGPRMRIFVLEQLLLTALADGHASANEVAFIRTFAEAAQVTTEQLAAMQAEAAAYYAANKEWIDAFASTDPAMEWADDVAERVAHAVTDNIGAVLTEIRQTGELGQLLAKAAGGNKLSPGEKKKVKGQLIDLAKAVPSLAIFAAPGGLLLLPLLSKLLPFDLLPSSFQTDRLDDDEKEG